MRTRKLLAATVVAALPLFVGAVHTPPPPSTADDAAPAHHVTKRQNGPRWLLAWGVDYEIATLVGDLYGGSWTGFAVTL